MCWFWCGLVGFLILCFACWLIVCCFSFLVTAVRRLVLGCFGIVYLHFTWLDFAQCLSVVGFVL